jgi:hypothetical protein
MKRRTHRSQFEDFVSELFNPTSLTMTIVQLAITFVVLFGLVQLVKYYWNAV